MKAGISDTVRRFRIVKAAAPYDRAIDMLKIRGAFHAACLRVLWIPGGNRMQNRIVKPASLHDDAGFLTEEGYATSPLLRYDRGRISAPAWRIKEWDYYYASDPVSRLSVSLTVSDLGYIGLIAAAAVDYDSAEVFQTSKLLVFPMGKLGLPPDSGDSDFGYEGKGRSVRFVTTGRTRRIHARCAFPVKGKASVPFSCDLSLDQDPDMDSLVIATSWKENRKAFYYNQKTVGMPVSGSVTLGKRNIAFSPESALGGIDWGRGVWTYKNRWYGASAAGRTGGRIVGWNLGYGFSDRTPASENMIFADGKGHKLADVTFRYDPADYMKPWKMTDSENRLDLDFTPVADRFSRTDLVVIKSVQHQVFGYYSGTMVLDSGERIAVTRIPGFAEDVLNWW